MPVAPDLGPRPLALGKWIVSGNRAIFSEPQDLSLMKGQILRAVALIAIADREEHMPFSVELDPRAKVNDERVRFARGEKFLEPGQVISFKRRSRKRGGRV